MQRSFLLTFVGLFFVTSCLVEIWGQLLLVDMFLLKAPLSATFPPPLSDKVLDAGPRPGVHHVAPVAGGSHGQLLESLH